MSQAKVDRYKQEKANRQKIMKQEKLEKLLWKIGGSIVGIVIVGWLGFSVYVQYGNDKVPVVKNYEVHTDAISEYLSDVVQTEEAE